MTRLFQEAIQLCAKTWRLPTRAEVQFAPIKIMETQFGRRGNYDAKMYNDKSFWPLTVRPIMVAIRAPPSQMLVMCIA